MTGFLWALELDEHYNLLSDSKSKAYRRLRTRNSLATEEAGRCLFISRTIREISQAMAAAPEGAVPTMKSCYWATGLSNSQAQQLTVDGRLQTY